MDGNFLFNFSLESSSEGDLKEEVESDGGPRLEGHDTLVPECDSTSRAGSLIPILPLHEGIVKQFKESESPPSSYKTLEGVTLKYVTGQHTDQILRATATTESSSQSVGGQEELESLLSLSNSRHSDLIPGVYEGGLKVWECAFDLVDFVCESSGEFSGSKVLELGCGAGLPGVAAMLKGAECVHFQDYNSEVLNYITVPNVLLNIIGEEENIRNSSLAKFLFCCGDWMTLPSLLGTQQKYDVILTSETIYSLDSQPRLLSALKQLSQEQSGVVYVAAKVYYFGVGGSVSAFSDLVAKDGTFTVTQIRRIEATVPRIILKLTHSTKCGKGSS